ncbi:MAG: hypothetical protein MUD01_14045 [Chloroflexaceae bacterium]|nr:hypothetical protein [Chloroflexaceae bacterium]
MAVTSRDIRNDRRPFISVPTRGVNSFAYIVTGLLALLALYVLLNTVIAWVQVVRDDMMYGRPRTFQLSAHVGHGEENGAQTQFIAMNLDRQVVIVEIPGGDPAKTRTYTGPYLVGAGEDLTPVTMRLSDLNGDKLLDLIVNVKSEEMVYVNRDGGFALMTPEERKQLATAQP